MPKEPPYDEDSGDLDGGGGFPYDDHSRRPDGPNEQSGQPDPFASTLADADALAHVVPQRVLLPPGDWLHLSGTRKGTPTLAQLKRAVASRVRVVFPVNVHRILVLQLPTTPAPIILVGNYACVARQLQNGHGAEFLGERLCFLMEGPLRFTATGEVRIARAHVDFNLDGTPVAASPITWLDEELGLHFPES